MATDRTRVGILVGGGPAPGINGTISAAAIEAVNSGLEVVGIYDGFEHLAAGETDAVRPLEISDVSRIHSQGLDPTDIPGESDTPARRSPTHRGVTALPGHHLPDYHRRR